MKDLNHYIEELLHTYDCVILPNLGGFIGNYKSAQWDRVKNHFNPPYKDVVFNSQLTHNDGLLMNYIAQQEGISPSEALYFIGEQVDQAWALLENKEVFEFNSIGSLHLTQAGYLQFESVINDTLLVDSYGSKVFDFTPLNARDSVIKTLYTASDEKVSFSLPSRQLRYMAIAGCLALGLVVLPITERLRNVEGGAQMALSLPFSILDSSKEQKVEVSSESLISIEAVAPEVLENHNVEKKRVAVEPVSAPSAKFYIVAGSFKTQSNAQRLFTRLKKAGESPMLDQMESGWYRVTSGEFTDKEKARRSLEIFRSDFDQKDAWILTKLVD